MHDRIRLVALAASLLAAAAAAGETATPTTVRNGTGPVTVRDFDGDDPWQGWQPIPGYRPGHGLAEWEEADLDFLAPASGITILELGAEGCGLAMFDALEVLAVGRGRGAAERRDPENPGFEQPGDIAGSAAGWKLDGAAARDERASYAGQACLLMNPAAPGRATASQELTLDGGRTHRITLRYRTDLPYGRAWLTLRPEGGGRALAEMELAACTLNGGKARCGALAAGRNQIRSTFTDLDVRTGTNRTLSLLVRGTIRERGRLILQTASLDQSGAETPLAARILAPQDLGPDWRPARLNLSLRNTSRLRVRITMEGPASAEFDNLELAPPVVIPTPRRMSVGDAPANFRPGQRCPLITSRGREDAALVRTFTGLAGERVARSGAAWQFWKSGRGFDHQSRPFARAEHGMLQGAVWLLDATRPEEAAWLAEQAITVPDHPGSYVISASPKSLIVTARSHEGFLSAASTLRWLGTDAADPEVFSCRIEDWPAHELRAAEFEFDGRLTRSGHALIESLGRYRLGQLLITGRGFWQLPDPRTRSEIRELAALAEASGLGTIVFLDALGQAPDLVARSPQCAEMIWHSEESHCLRGTERSRLEAGNVVAAAGAPVEVTSAGGEVYAAGRDYELQLPPPQPGAAGDAAPRTWLRRLPGGRIPDGGHVLLSYNALPPPGTLPAACPAAAEGPPLFAQQVRLAAEAAAGPFGFGLGGRLPGLMRTDRRTAGTRLQNGRLTADRIRELVSALALAAPATGPLLWGDTLNPCGGLQLPADSPAASAELLDPELRRQLTVLVRLDRSDAAGRDLIARSTDYLLSRGYRLAAWCGTSGAAAEQWAAEFSRWEANPRSTDGQTKPGRPAGMAIDAGRARVLDLERFAQAAWHGAPAPETGTRPAGAD